MDTSGESNLVIGKDGKMRKKTKKDKKDKDSKKLSKEEKAKLKEQKMLEKKAKKAKKEAEKKKKKGKFGIFGGKKKNKKQESSSSSDGSSSDSSSSSSDSDSDDSVIQEAREGAQPGDLDASLAASEKLMLQESGVLSQADVSNRSLTVGDHQATVEEGGPKVVRTTTKKTMVAAGGEVSESMVEKVEDVNTGEVNISTMQQTKVSVTLL